MHCFIAFISFKFLYRRYFFAYKEESHWFCLLKVLWKTIFMLDSIELYNNFLYKMISFFLIIIEYKSDSIILFIIFFTMFWHLSFCFILIKMTMRKVFALDSIKFYINFLYKMLLFFLIMIEYRSDSLFYFRFSLVIFWHSHSFLTFFINFSLIAIVYLNDDSLSYLKLRMWMFDAIKNINWLYICLQSCSIKSFREMINIHWLLLICRNSLSISTIIW